MHRRFLVAIALALPALAGCGNSDNQVYGGIVGTGTASNAFLPDILSAIHAVYQTTDKTGHARSVSMMVLTDHGNLCAALAAHPDYFKKPVEPFVALLMTTTADRLGTFHLELSNDGGGQILATSGPGQPIFGYVGYQGIISLKQFSAVPGDQAVGTFDFLASDSASVSHEIFGKFKTSECAALSSAVF